MEAKPTFCLVANLHCYLYYSPCPCLLSGIRPTPVRSITVPSPQWDTP